MSEMQNLLHMKPITSLVVIPLPGGRFGYAGRVPCDIGYIDPTPEKIAAAAFGERFGPKHRNFSTREEAILFAENAGYTVDNK